MISTRPTAELIQIVSYGGGLDFDASNKPMPDLIQIASYAQSGGGQVTMRGISGKPVAELVQIASYGKGRVVFAD
jgi:hypothetical protein